MSHGSDVILLHSELADDGVAAKYVFRAQDARGRWATFETGSFFDNNWRPRAKPIHDICVSTAGGCTRRCTFCGVPSAALGFERLLTSDEIVNQVDWAIRLRNESGTRVNQVGFMGNGEPPDNPATVDAIERLATGSHPLSRIYVSTIGENARGVEDLSFAVRSHDLGIPVILQLSLHSASDAKRRELVPGRRSVADVMRLADVFHHSAYGLDGNFNPLRINVTLMERSDGFTNASVADAECLAEELLKPSAVTGQPIRRPLKLSWYNPIPGLHYRRPNQGTVDKFMAALRSFGVYDIHSFKGSGIDIASQNASGGFSCGQLRTTTRLPVEAKH